MYQTTSRKSVFTEPNNVIPKKELYRIMKRFIADPNRGISMALFSEVAGVGERNMLEIFVYEKNNCSEIIQRRVSKAYKQWVAGELAIMANRDKTRYVEYRKVPKPRLGRSYGLQVVGDEIKLKIGIRNKAEYSETLDEQLDRG